MTTRPLYASSTSPVTWLRACWRRLARRRVTPEKSLVTTMDSRVKTRNSRVMTTLNRNIITTEPTMSTTEVTRRRMPYCMASDILSMSLVKWLRVAPVWWLSR